MKEKAARDSHDKSRLSNDVIDILKRTQLKGNNMEWPGKLVDQRLPLNGSCQEKVFYINTTQLHTITFNIR